MLPIKPSLHVAEDIIYLLCVYIRAGRGESVALASDLSFLCQSDFPLTVAFFQFVLYFDFGGMGKGQKLDILCRSWNMVMTCLPPSINDSNADVIEVMF